jgi:hypothetical protein
VVALVVDAQKIRLIGAPWRVTKMVVQGAREPMFCHVVPICIPCSGSLACCPSTICADERALIGWQAGR